MPANGNEAEKAGRRWARIAPTLLCGLLAVLSLILVSFRPPVERLMGVLVVAFIIVIIIAYEFNQGKGERENGQVELRSVRLAGAVRPAFVAPTSDHFYVGQMLMAMLLGGLTVYLLILTSPQWNYSPNPTPWRIIAAMGLGYTALLTANAVPALRRGYYLALLPEGVMWSHPGMSCFVPWEVIREVRLIKLGRLGPLCLGIRVTETDRIEAAALTRRRIRTSSARGLWHCVWPIGQVALPPRKLAWLVHAYSTQPGERHKIGTTAELEEVRTALAQIPFR
jgi:hypothetical protein